jgi:hypothetical protein
MHLNGPMLKTDELWYKDWRQIGEDLGELQRTVALYKARFEAVGRADVAKDLEKCVRFLISAQNISEKLSSCQPNG